MNIQNIIVLAIVFISKFVLPMNLTESPFLKNGTTYIQFSNKNNKIGESLYKIRDMFLDDNKNSVKLLIIRVFAKEQNKGFGSEIFILTMQHIHKTYPSIEKVYWDVCPLDMPENVSYEEAMQKLYKFYRKVGATVNEENNTAQINLKEAGYFDEK